MIKSAKKNLQTITVQIVHGGECPSGALVATNPTTGKALRKANTAAAVPFNAALPADKMNHLGICLTGKGTSSANDNIIVCTQGFEGVIYVDPGDTSDIIDSVVTWSIGDSLFWAVDNTGPTFGDAFWTNTDTKADCMVDPIAYGSVIEIRDINGDIVSGVVLGTTAGTAKYFKVKLF
jgi:hypothetical protein